MAKREAVSHLRDHHKVSERRACKVLQFDRSSIRYKSRSRDDGRVRLAMKRIANERKRFGYRRIHILLQREGFMLNQKKLRRLYREEGLQVRKRGGRKRGISTRRPMILPNNINQRWSLDFVSDAFTDGRRFRILCIIDDYSRECLGLIPDTSLSGLRMVRELDEIIKKRGKPNVIVSDNGTEMTSRQY